MKSKLLSILGIMMIAASVLIPLFVFRPWVMYFLKARDYDGGQCLVKMEHDPITFGDPDITDVEFELKKWQADNEGRVRQSMVRDLVRNHKELFMGQPAADVKETLVSDASLWYWAHPSKEDFGCRLARRGLKYQNCIQFNVKDGRVIGYVANVEKVW